MQLWLRLLTEDEHIELGGRLDRRQLASFDAFGDGVDASKALCLQSASQAYSTRSLTQCPLDSEVLVGQLGLRSLDDVAASQGNSPLMITTHCFHLDCGLLL